MPGSETNLYEGVLFGGKEGDLKTSTQGLSFQDYEDEKVTRFKWSTVIKHVTTKPGSEKAMIRITMVRQGMSKTVVFQLPEFPQLMRLRDDINARTEKTSAAASAPASAVPAAGVTNALNHASGEDKTKFDAPALKPETLKKSKEESPVSAAQTAALVPVTTGFVKTAEPIKVKQCEDVLQKQATPTKKSTVTASAVSTKSRANGDIYGTSKYLAPMENPQLIAEAEFEDFAPSSSICCKCFVNDKMRGRTYVRAYENRVEANLPYNAFCCFGDERCMLDSTRVYYFDKAPHRVGMCCCFIPCICCGPPVIFTKVPKVCCALIDVRPCYGEQILYSPCECFGLRACCCCGPQCYQCCALPLFGIPFKNGEIFLAKWKGALEEYQGRTGLPKAQGAKYLNVEDRFCDTDSGTPIQAISMER